MANDKKVTIKEEKLVDLINDIVEKTIAERNLVPSKVIPAKPKKMTVTESQLRDLQAKGVKINSIVNKKVILENGDEEMARAESLEKLFRTPEGYPPINSLEDLISQAIDITHKYDYRSDEVGRAAAHIARRFELPTHN